MVEDSATELRARLDFAQELLAETRHQRDTLEAHLAEAGAAQKELRELLLRQQELLISSDHERHGAVPLSGAQSGHDLHQRRVEVDDEPDHDSLQLPVESGVPGAPREPTLVEWWRDIDRTRRLGASLLLSALVSAAFAFGLHFALLGHFIEPSLRLGYIFGLTALALFILGVGLLF